MKEWSSMAGGCKACGLDLYGVNSHKCTVLGPGITAMQAAQRRPGVNKGGRPKGFDGTRSKMPSALAFAFKKSGLDWKEDFAKAIKESKRERIKMWLKLLPYLITTSSRAKIRSWKGRPSKAAKIALEAMEQDPGRVQ